MKSTFTSKKKMTSALILYR